jgi:hypothetical protein
MFLHLTNPHIQFRLITNCTRQMTRATLAAKIAAIAYAMPRHTFGGIQALFCFDHSATDGKILKCYCWIYNIGF